MKPKVLIIGYGNPLRGDDGVGWCAAQRLSSELSSEQAEVIACHQLMPEHAERISYVDIVIFIDASMGSSPGLIACSSIEAASALPANLSHHINPSVLLECSRVLYQSNPKAYFLSVCGDSFDLNEGLSPAVSSALPELVRKACELVSQSELHGEAQDKGCDGMRARFPGAPLDKRRISEVECHGDRYFQPRKDRQG